MKINDAIRKQLNRLPALVALNSGGNKTEAEYRRLWHELLDQSSALGYNIMAVVNPPAKVDGQQTLHHPVMLRPTEYEGAETPEIEVENTIFVQSRYWPANSDKVEFVGYFS